MKNLLMTVLFLLISSFHLLYGQGWEKNYGRENDDRLTNVMETEDGGYLAFGYSQNPDEFITQMFLQKVDIDGNKQWSKFYSGALGIVFRSRQSSILTADGGILMMGLSNNNNKVYLVKTDINGIEEWSNEINYPGFINELSKILQTEDGGYILAYSHSNNSHSYIKTSSLGAEEWSYNISEISATNVDYPPDIEILNDGYLLSGVKKLVKLDLLGEEVWVKTLEDEIYYITLLSDGNFMLMNLVDEDGWHSHKLSKRNPNGDEIWNNPVGLLLGFSGNAVPLVETDDGGFIIANKTIGSTPQVVGFQTLLLKTNSLGEVEWSKKIGAIGYDNYFLIKDSSGKLIFAGEDDIADNPQSSNGFLMKTDQQGNIYSNHVIGNVFEDDNLDCIFEEGTEDGFANRIVQVAGNKTFYGTSDEMGNYTINVDTGSYEVSVVIPNPYWTTCDPQPINISEFYTDTIIDLGIQALIDCPYLTVDISTPFLRRCFENNYTVHYCNNGTISAEDAYIEVDFDHFLEVQSSSLPWTSQVGNTYTFDVGTLDPTDCGSFNVTTLVSCDSTILGQTHCTEAHIFPDSICLPSSANWDGSSIVVEADCDVDSVRFLIRNIGTGNMQEALEYIIIEDEIMVHQDNFQLDAGQSELLSDGYSSDGSTYRIIAEQTEGHPGNNMPTAAIEGCGTTIFPFGFFNMFSQNDEDFFLSIDCQENIGSYDPNDKQAFPTGYGDEHYIWQNTDLEYFIRFQNTGTDTAFTVVVRDTISENLDITSLQMGASSHNYTYTIDGEGFLKVTFDNILLPDSTTNLLASNGFFKYKIKQQPDLPIGTMIYNEAAIYFDFNAPIITNETYHEIGEPFFGTLVFTNDLTTNNINLNVFPNPFGAFTTFEIENIPDGETDFLLYDNLGRLVRKEAVLDEKEFQFHRKGLTSGLYFYEFQQNGASVASGKMVAK